MIFLFVLCSAGCPPASLLATLLLSCRTNARSIRARQTIGSAARKGCAVATQPSGKAAPELPQYLRAAEVAAILQVSPKTVSRWATEGKLPFLKTLVGHRRYPATEIRQLADELQVQPTT
jgi:excisionase family DNA binding protein